MTLIQVFDALNGEDVNGIDLKNGTAFRGRLNRTGIVGGPIR